MAQTEETNNSYLGNKVALRLHQLPAEPAVLDCYGGARVIWQAIEQELNRPVHYIGIDQKNYDIGFYLPGDNLGYLQSLDLSRFNIIDLDAYGIPYAQLKIIFERGYQGRVFVTAIQSVYGEIPHGLLEEIGFSHAMIKNCRTLFGQRGWQFFLEWLAQRGVRQIRHRSKMRKHYLAFDI